MKTDYIKRERALDAFCKDCRGLERGKCEYYDNSCKTIETLLFVPSEAVVPKDFHDKTFEAMAKRHTEEIQKMYEEGDHDCKSEQTERDGLQMNMEEYKVRLGEDVVLDLGIAPDWYISALSYDRASVTITLRPDNLLLANKLLPGEEIYMKQLLDEKSQTVLQSGGQQNCIPERRRLR